MIISKDKFIEIINRLKSYDELQNVVDNICDYFSYEEV